MLSALEKSIEVLEQSVYQCKHIQDSIIKNKRILSDSTNINKEDYDTKLDHEKLHQKKVDLEKENIFDSLNQNNIKKRKKIGSKFLENKLFRNK